MKFRCENFRLKMDTDTTPLPLPSLFDASAARPQPNLQCTRFTGGKGWLYGTQAFLTIDEAGPATSSTANKTSGGLLPSARDGPEEDVRVSITVRVCSRRGVGEWKGRGGD